MAPTLKYPWEIDIMREAGRIAARALRLAVERAVPGATTKGIDAEVERYIRAQGALPTFKGYRGYPASLCASVNDVVVHGIPDDRPLREGDLLSVDVGATYKGYVGDNATTVGIGSISEEARRLVEAALGSLEAAIAEVKPYGRLSRIASAVQTYAESRGYSVVKKFVGHGIGQQMHEDPQVPNYVIHPVERFEVILKPGLCLAIEPMLNAGSDDVETMDDGWTVRTRDRKLSAHVEHTVAVTKEGSVILTLP